MNYIPKIAEVMGLKIGEQFKVKVGGEETTTIFWFVDDGLKYAVTKGVEGYTGYASNQTLVSIVNGEYEIVKLPWVPRIGETYWCVKPSSDPDHPQTALVTMNYSIFTLFNLIFGNCFQTQEEAEEHKKYFVKNLKSYEKAQRQQILERG